MNILIMRAFVRLRQVLASYKSLAEKVDAVERTGFVYSKSKKK